MTRRERVKAAIRHEQTDIVPYNVSFTKQEYDKVADHLGDRDFISGIGNHIKSVYYDGNLSEIGKGTGYWKDDFGVLWNRNGVDKDIGVIEGYVIKEPGSRGYVFPEIDEAGIRAEYAAMCESDDDMYRFGSIGFSLFERAWTLRGMENFLSDLVLYPGKAQELLEDITEYNLKIIDIALEFDIDGFHFGDDWGQQHGLIMGPVYWKKYIKPFVEKMYLRVKSKGLIVSQHSCGDIHEIFSDLIDAGLDVYQTFQPEIYDIKGIKDKFGKDLTFWGGISTQTLLPFALPEEVRRVTRQTMEILGREGGYIAAPTHSIPGDVPAENVMAMIEVL